MAIMTTYSGTTEGWLIKPIRELMLLGTTSMNLCHVSPILRIKLSKTTD